MGDRSHFGTSSKNTRKPTNRTFKMDYGPHSSETYGKKHVEVKGPFERYQARVDPEMNFNNADRAWRARWLKEQHHLKGGDGQDLIKLYDNPEFQKARFNIFRRIWQTPMNLFEKALKGPLGDSKAAVVRYTTTKFGQLLVISWITVYYAMYNRRGWEKQQGWKVFPTKPAIYPGHPEWPHQQSAQKTKTDYADYGFKTSGM